jgi:hypothetical protein
MYSPSNPDTLPYALVRTLSSPPTDRYPDSDILTLFDDTDLFSAVPVLWENWKDKPDPGLSVEETKSARRATAMVEVLGWTGVFRGSVALCQEATRRGWDPKASTSRHATDLLLKIHATADAADQGFIQENAGDMVSPKDPGQARSALWAFAMNNAQWPTAEWLMANGVVVPQPPADPRRSSDTSPFFLLARRNKNRRVQEWDNPVYMNACRSLIEHFSRTGHNPVPHLRTAIKWGNAPYWRAFGQDVDRRQIPEMYEDLVYGVRDNLEDAGHRSSQVLTALLESDDPPVREAREIFDDFIRRDFHTVLTEGLQRQVENRVVFADIAIGFPRHRFAEKIGAVARDEEEAAASPSTSVRRRL